MEISGFGMINMDDYRLSSPSAIHGSHNQNFASVLERIRSSQTHEQAADNADRNASPGAGIDKSDKLYQLCLDLETFIVKNMISGMRNTVQKSGFVDDSFAGKMYEDMLYDEYAKEFTRSANFGLAEQAYKQLKRIN